MYLKSQLAKSILYNCLFTSICLLAVLFPAGFVGGISMFAYVLPPPPLYIKMDGVSPLLATCTQLKPKYPIRGVLPSCSSDTICSSSD